MTDRRRRRIEASWVPGLHAGTSNRQRGPTTDTVCVGARPLNDQERLGVRIAVKRLCVDLGLTADDAEQVIAIWGAER